MTVRAGRQAGVDPFGVGAGAFNTVMSVGFDAAGRVLLAYVRYDPAGRTQLYLARHDPAGRWDIRQASNWTARYEMRGVGWFELPLEIGPPEWRAGQLLIELLHGEESPAPRLFSIDPDTLLLCGPADASAAAAATAAAAAAGLEVPTSTFPGMQVRLPAPHCSHNIKHEQKSWSLGPNTAVAPALF